MDQEKKEVQLHRSCLTCKYWEFVYGIGNICILKLHIALRTPNQECDLYDIKKELK